MRYIMMLLVLIGGYANAHQWTPTYPKLKLSHVSGIMKVDMELFNSRQDVGWYEISVFDKDWNPVKFAVGGERILNVPYLKKQKVEVYVRFGDTKLVKYICSKSKIIAEDERVTVVSSRICSKLK